MPNPSGATFNFLFLYKVNDDYVNLNVSSNSVSCSDYSMPPYMAQPGGGKPMQLWWFFYSEQVQRNGKIYAAHSTKIILNNTAGIHYMEINTADQLLTSEIFVSSADHYYGYPDILADQNNNVFMVYNRSGATEYPGIYYTIKPNGADNFLNDNLLKSGEGDVNVFCGNTSNPYIRFEDYTDIMFDPVDSTILWIMGEYIGADNKWKTRIGKLSIDNTIGITNIDYSLPEKFSLKQNYPNPFNPVTKISFTIAFSDLVKLNVYNALGIEVAVLINKDLQPGSYDFLFDGIGFPSGVYFYKLQSDNFSQTRSMLLIK
ncbi:MAG: T9SS type A sorting domain-containing protein [Ignavibacteria bacterium]|nr:T9SS type A sorting domain-containing protein [Ignavibacteria bacterium]